MAHVPVPSQKEVRTLLLCAREALGALTCACPAGRWRRPCYGGRRWSCCSATRAKPFRPRVKRPERCWDCEAAPARLPEPSPPRGSDGTQRRRLAVVFLTLFLPFFTCFSIKMLKSDRPSVLRSLCFRLLKLGVCVMSSASSLGPWGSSGWEGVHERDGLTFPLRRPPSSSVTSTAATATLVDSVCQLIGDHLQHVTG